MNISAKKFPGCAAFLLTLALSFCLPATAKAQSSGPIRSDLEGADAGSLPVGTPNEHQAHAVSLITPKREIWPEQVEAHGNIMPWQETRIGTEIGGLRLLSVQANIGDVVKKGQVLARLNPATIQIELETANAQLMEAQAAQAQAAATYQRGKRLAVSGGVSQQELTQYEMQKQTTDARLNAAQAQVKAQQLRLESATLVAPDDGIISARLASEGAIVGAGSELFRLIRQGRLEWRAEVKQELLLKIAVGQEVTVKGPVGSPVTGRVRQVSPTIDLTTRTGLAYVDLPSDTNLRAGLSVSGIFTTVKRKVLALPASALRSKGEDAQVFTVGADGTVVAVNVRVGRTQGEWVEIVSGLSGQPKVIAKDADSLKPGDAVNVIEDDGQDVLTQASTMPSKPEN